MLTRFNNKVFSDLLESKTPFILMVYFMNQGKKKESGNGFYDMLTLYPSFIEKYDDKKDNKLPNHLIEYHKLYPDIIIMESYHYEVYDTVIDLGFNYDLLWKDNDSIFRPLMFGFKGYSDFMSSYNDCYCVETLTNIGIFTNPELFEPSSVSES